MSIHLQKISSLEPVVDFLFNLLSKELEDSQTVFWLVPGGSSIKIAALVSQRLAQQDHHRLIVSLTDERYGPVDHQDSNWHQLQEAGFALPEATLLPVLLNNRDYTQVITEYGNSLHRALEQAAVSIGFFGIGADGHTAGMLPNSPAVTSLDYACGYQTETFNRITMTPVAVKQLDIAVAYAIGQEKWPIIDQLADNTIALTEQPAQILKTVPEFTLFNDYRESDR